ncbi:hypothetical protein IAD21_02997 [Abditibacteriota bacterium]|nr:hypothetical protein IAD21_02997 [Abditibacteriota bacterium]
MIDPQSQEQLKQEIEDRMKADCVLLDQLRAEIRPLRNQVRQIQPRTTTSISLVATDGGNNSIKFDPFLVQVVRVVDSSNNEYSLEVITPTTNISTLSEKHFKGDSTGRTPLGEMMNYLGVTQLAELSHMIRSNDGDSPTSPTWVQVYRELVEWATLFSIIRKKDFGSDTLIICDGLLRSKVFAKDLFKKYLQGIQEGIETQRTKSRRRIYLAGVAKHSKVLSRYRLAMALENILMTTFPTYAEIPRDIEEKAYIWSEYARGDDQETERGEINKFVGGKMFFVKFGSGARDPVWPIDIFLPQVADAQIIIGYMLADAINGFPVPFYPQCLQKAHENAALVDFDFDIMQDLVFSGLRNALADEAPKLDSFQFQDADPAQARYS